VTINAEHVPELNRLTVLKSINQKKPFTRMDIVRKANLSLPTVNNILLDLKEAGYVKEVGSDRSRGGRPPTLFHFNPAARYAIGIEIQLPTISIGLVNLQEELVALAEHDFKDDATSDYVIRTLQNGITDLLTKQQIDVSRLIGIGLGVPGFVDQDTGVWLRYTRMPHLRDLPLITPLSDTFGVPVYTQNESNVYALAELRSGSLRQQRDTIFINWSEGIKATVVVDGRILSGQYGNFGAIGHFIVVEHGRDCYCGSKGCLEMYASGYAFREAISIKAGQRSSPKPEEVFKLAAQGDPICREIVEEAMPSTGYAFASLTRVTDIYNVILLGAYIDGGEYLLNLLYDDMARRLPGVAKRNLSLQFGSKHNIETVLEAAAVPAIAGHFKLQTYELGT
jgi:predicted NBD/HSP70 family sugar kinase